MFKFIFSFIILFSFHSYSSVTEYKVYKISEAKKDELGNAISSIPIFGDIISKDSIKDEYLHSEYSNGKIKVSLKKKEKVFENNDVFTLKLGISSYEFDLKSNIVNQLDENNKTVKKFLLTKIIDTGILSKKINLLNEEKTTLLKELKKEKDYVLFIEEENFFLSEEKKKLLIQKTQLKREHKKKISKYSQKSIELSNQILRLQKKIDVDLKNQNKKEIDKLKEKINSLSSSKIKLEKTISKREINNNRLIDEFKNKITNLEELNIKLEKENKERQNQTDPIISKLKESESYIAELSSELAKEKEIVRDFKKQSLKLVQSEEQKNNKVCPKSKNTTWDNCFGIDVYEEGKYEGFFKNSKKDGLGTYYFANGQKHVGEWKDNELNGLGTKYYPDGRIKKGEYKNYKLNGYGITYNADGTIDKQGIWKDDEFQYAENNEKNRNKTNIKPRVDIKKEKTKKALGDYKGNYIFDAKEYISNYEDYTISSGMFHTLFCLRNSLIYSKQIMNAIQEDKYPNQVKILSDFKNAGSKNILDLKKQEIFLKKNLKPTSFKLYENKIEWLDADLKNEIENDITFIDKVPLGSGTDPRFKVSLEILQYNNSDRIFLRTTSLEGPLLNVTCSMPFRKITRKRN